MPNEDAQFNKRRISLNKEFINCMQANVEYLSVKFGIPTRPLVFLDRVTVSSLVDRSFNDMFLPER
jgi:hypothetical protein